MTGTNDPLFSDRLMERYQASIVATSEQRELVTTRVMKAAGLPRLGTSGAANCYLLLVGSEFGAVSTPSSPRYSRETMGAEGWDELWRLRVGEPNPHFDPKWTSLRNTTRMWERLHDWLPAVFDDAAVAYALFGWANLSVTAGGTDLGTKSSHHDGMRQYVAPLINASGARVVVAANDRVKAQMDRWATEAGGSVARFNDIQGWRVNIGHRVVLAAKVGHPSLRISRAEYVRQLRILISAAETAT